MPDADAETPRAFISYSWSSQGHEQWVLDLATRLRESGVNVILDKWDLKEGADKYVFMEKMVTDPSIRKVIVVCDRVYAAKADDREGGVGTETQIISQKIYNQVNKIGQEQKFVAVITEKDEHGEAYIPTFLKSRIYIDMSEASIYDEGFEKLLRWIFDKPLYQKPSLGKPPAFLTEAEKPSLGTASRHRMVMDALRQGKATAPGLLKEYFETFATNLEMLRVHPQEGKEFDDQVVESIEAFLPYRNEAIEVFMGLARYLPTPEGYNSLHSFLERLLAYCFRPEGPGAYVGWEQDNLKFIIHELFLYAVTALLKLERFEGVQGLTEQEYFLPPDLSGIRSGMFPFIYFFNLLRSLSYRNKRLNLRRLSLHADILTNRATLAEIKLDALLQSDFVLFLRGHLHSVPDKWIRDHWFPVSLLYADRHYGPFEIFARSQSGKYFDRLKIALGIESKNALEILLQKYQKGELRIPSGGFESFNPSTLMNIENLATRP